MDLSVYVIKHFPSSQRVGKMSILTRLVFVSIDNIYPCIGDPCKALDFSPKY
jgi:hypothetical protein